MTWTLFSERLLGVSMDLAVLAMLVWGALRLLRPRSPRLVALLWLLVMVRPLVGLAFGPAILIDLPAVRAPSSSTGQSDTSSRTGRRRTTCPESCGSSSRRSSSSIPSGPEGRFHLDAEGRFALARNHEDVHSLEPGSRLTIEEEGEEDVRIEITAGPDGEVRRVFTVNGEERPYDWRGRVWMARTLPRFAHELERWGHMRPVTRAWRRIESRAERLLR